MMKHCLKSLYFVLSFFFTLALTACGNDDNSSPSTTAITITLSSENVAAPAAGGKYSVDVKVSSGEWTAYTDNSPWLRISSTGTTTTAGNIAITVAKHTETAPRTATITVKAGQERKTITVTQDAPMQVDADVVYFRSVGESKTVAVTAAAAWEAASDAAWVKCEQTDAKTLTVTTEPNESAESREGTVTVTCGEEEAKIKVVQNGADDRSIAEPPVKGYHLVWHDEFAEDGSLNVQDWRHEVKGDHWVNNELQNYVNEKSPGGQRVTEIIDGKLHINCFKERDKEGHEKVYSGRVYAKSAQGWQYGYVEARIKLPSGKGTWPAFWMMPVHFTSWPKDGEIDIMEEVGYHKDYVSSSLHADGHVHSKGTQVTKEVYCKGAEGDFHVYGMEWTPEYFQFYVDGQKTLYYKNPELAENYSHAKGYDWPYDAPFYVILNLAWGGDWGGSQGVDESKLPLTMEVDYVRVFQK